MLRDLYSRQPHGRLSFSVIVLLHDAFAAPARQRPDPTWSGVAVTRYLQTFFQHLMALTRAPLALALAATETAPYTVSETAGADEAARRIVVLNAEGVPEEDAPPSELAAFTDMSLLEVADGHLRVSQATPLHRSFMVVVNGEDHWLTEALILSFFMEIRPTRRRGPPEQEGFRSQ